MHYDRLSNLTHSVRTKDIKTNIDKALIVLWYSFTRQHERSTNNPTPAVVQWGSLEEFAEWAHANAHGNRDARDPDAEVSAPRGRWTFSSTILPPKYTPEGAPILGPETCCFIPSKLAKMKLGLDRYPHGDHLPVEGVRVTVERGKVNYAVHLGPVEGWCQFGSYCEAFDALEEKLREQVLVIVKREMDARGADDFGVLPKLIDWRLPKGEAYHTNGARIQDYVSSLPVSSRAITPTLIRRSFSDKAGENTVRAGTLHSTGAINRYVHDRAPVDGRYDWDKSLAERRPPPAGLKASNVVYLEDGTVVRGRPDLRALHVDPSKPYNTSPKGEELMRFRKMIGHSRHRASEIIGVSANTVYSWEKGKTKMPAADWQRYRLSYERDGMPLDRVKTAKEIQRGAPLPQASQEQIDIRMNMALYGTPTGPAPIKREVKTLDDLPLPQVELRIPGTDRLLNPPRRPDENPDRITPDHPAFDLL